MKITTWNVNGIRAALKKEFMSWFEESRPDVLCLQEIKAYKEQVPDELTAAPGYTQFWNSADRAGYSGVATLSKTEPISNNGGI